jgi:hypothetical protein
VVEDAKRRVGAYGSVDASRPGFAEPHRVYLRRWGLGEMLVILAEDEVPAQGASRIYFWSETLSHCA